MYSIKYMHKNILLSLFCISHPHLHTFLVHCKKLKLFRHIRSCPPFYVWFLYNEKVGIEFRRKDISGKNRLAKSIEVSVLLQQNSLKNMSNNRNIILVCVHVCVCTFPSSCKKKPREKLYHFCCFFLFF